MLLIALLLSLSASADQLSHEVRRGPQQWRFDIAWTDQAGHRQDAAFDLPSTGVRADLKEPLRLDLAEAAEQVAKVVRRAARGMPGVSATVRSGGQGKVDISVSAGSRAEVAQALAELGEARDRAWQELLDARGYTRIRGGISPDHARHAADYADELAPVVAALGGPGASPRDFADRALAFVQSIPYERRARISDRYRRPLSLLGRNRGDCDSKTTLFLGLMRQAWPQTELAVAYVEGHAFALLDLERQKGDQRLKAEGRKWVAAEPVGPAMATVGELADGSKRAFKRGWHEVRVVPR